MKFLSIIFAFFIATSAYAYIWHEDDYGAQIRVLKELDIDASYMKDPYFLEMQANSTSASRKHFMKAIDEEYKHISVLKNILGKNELPKSALYLAVVESGLSNHVSSGRGAVGIWQLMPSSAKRLGLRVDKYIDERRDPIKSTQAAVKYLNTLKDKFGKWYLALLAYNCGDGKLSKAIKAAGSDKLSVLIDPNKKYLGKETRTFIRKILLTAKVAEDVDYIIAGDSALFNNPVQNSVATVMVPAGASLKAVAQSAGISEHRVKELNPHILKGVIPAGVGEYAVYIPRGKEELFAANFDAKSAVSASKAELASAGKESKKSKKISNLNYVVKKGDTLLGISHKFGVKVSALKKANGLRGSNLNIGDSIVIPQ